MNRWIYILTACGLATLLTACGMKPDGSAATSQYRSDTVIFTEAAADGIQKIEHVRGCTEHPDSCQSRSRRYLF